MRMRVCFIAAAVAIFVPVALAANGGASGDLDPTFGTGGRVIVSPGVGSRAQAAVVQPDGKVVLGGFVSDPAPPGHWWYTDFLAVRLNQNGGLDPTFGTGGIVRTPIDLGDTNWDVAEAAALGPDGSIVLAGTAGNSLGGVDLAVVRYTQFGALDTSFSGDGILTINVGPSETLSGAAVQPDGKIVAVGHAGSGFMVMRLLPNGALDEGFGSGGIVDTNVRDPAYRDSANGVVVLGDGKIVVAGINDIDYPSYNPVSTDFALVRYLPNGQRDPTFGQDGIVVTPGTKVEVANGIAAARDGKIVLAGWSGTPPIPRYGGGESSFQLARYLPSGALDATFGIGGTVTTSFDGGSSAAVSVDVESNGKLVAGGSARGGIAVARYNEDGTLDPTFGVTGKRTYTGPYVSALAIQRAAARSGSDRLVLAGVTRAGIGREDSVAAIGIDLGPPPPVPPVRCRVPRVVGLTLGRARARIRLAHCKVGRVRRARSTRRRGRVVSQHPQAGRRLPSGSRVNLVVSRGRR